MIEIASAMLFTALTGREIIFQGFLVAGMPWGEASMGIAGIGTRIWIGLLMVTDAWFARPTLLPALAYGLGTVVFPFLLLQPALGLGIASAKTPNPHKARIKSLATHTVFGFGLYAGAVVISAMSV